MTVATAIEMPEPRLASPAVREHDSANSEFYAKIDRGNAAIERGECVTISFDELRAMRR